MSVAGSSTDDALKDLKTGYCLWLGAGIGMGLGASAGTTVPGWDGVVQEMEREANLTAPPGVGYSDRIERCLRKLRRLRFQRHLRQTIVRPLSEAILQLANAHAAGSPCIPSAIRQLAHLGAIANPIVNFNIETVTSRLVAEPSGLSNIRCFAPPVPGATTLTRAPPPPTLLFRRNVYHPHGALDDTGICVMASSEYESMHGTLALQIAVHNAFESNLVIVGMSLEDEYLRQQLRSFRSQIGTIYWFVDSATEGTKAWAWQNDLTLVEQPWPAFWEAAERILPGPVKEDWLYDTWSSVVHEAAHEVHGRQRLHRQLAAEHRWSAETGKPFYPDSLEERRWLARLQGEDGPEQMTPEEQVDIPVCAQEAYWAIARRRDVAKRTDRFCSTVAESGVVFFEWTATGNASAAIQATLARRFWSSEALARSALGPTDSSPNKVVEFRWSEIVQQWRVEGANTFSIQVDGRGDSTTTEELLAATIVARIEALMSR